MTIVPVFAGLDYHEDSIRVCVLDKNGRELVGRNCPNDVDYVAELIVSQGWPVNCALEACGGAAEFADQLQRRYELDVRLAHPGYVRRMKQNPDKSDAADAFVLADLVRMNYLPEVWLAPVWVRQLRRLTRYRRGLVNERKNYKLRVRALLREERAGRGPGNAWTKGWLAWARHEASLGEQGRWVMGQLLDQIEHLSRQIAEVEKRLLEAVQDDPLTALLCRQPGIALVTAATLRAEIGSFTRFRNGKQLSRYSGVSPRNASTGKRQADAGLMRAANEELRTVLLECAHRLARYDARWRAMKERMRGKKPMSVIAAAIANRYVRWLYHQMAQHQQTLEVAA